MQEEVVVVRRGSIVAGGRVGRNRVVRHVRRHREVELLEQLRVALHERIDRVGSARGGGQAGTHCAEASPLVRNLSKAHSIGPPEALATFENLE